ncbi:MAG: hypothetical protein V6Z89_21595 [Desulfobacter sp.]
MKQLILAVLMMGIPVVSLAVEVDVVKPYVITAEESHNSVIEVTVPNGKSILSVLFNGSDSVASVEHYSNFSQFFAIKNKGKMVLLKTSLANDTPKDSVISFYILTKEGKTHTINFVTLGKTYKKEQLTQKIIIQSDEVTLEKTKN